VAYGASVARRAISNLFTKLKRINLPEEFLTTWNIEKFFYFSQRPVTGL